MPAKSVYLDSSSIVKRYVEEKGTETVDRVYDAAEVGNLKIHFSIWNVGEVLGTLDRYFMRSIITEDEFKASLSDFVAESIKLGKLGSLMVLPLTADLLIEAWLIVLRQHVYEADALQIAAAKGLSCDMLLTAEKSLVNTCKAESLAAFDVEKDQEKILAALMS